jgi:hypothetical protein
MLRFVYGRQWRKLANEERQRYRYNCWFGPDDGLHKLRLLWTAAAHVALYTEIERAEAEYKAGYERKCERISYMETHHDNGDDRVVVKKLPGRRDS